MRFVSSVPYVPVSEERKLKLESIIRDANALVQLHSKNSGLGADSLRNLIFSGKAPKGISGHDIDVISLAKTAEWDLLCAFSNLVAKIVNKWSANISAPAFSSEDLASEAFAAGIKAARNFSQEGVRFSTFLYVCVNRRLSSLCMRSGFASPISRSAAKLKMQYGILSAEEGATFDSVVQKMGLSRKQMADLICSLKRLETTQDDECFMKVVDNHEEIAEDQLSGINVASLIDRLELSDLERAVLEGFMSSGSKMGLSSVSKKLTNPKTKKPYSRMAFSLAWTRVKEKIIRAYSDVA
jgi:DNA-directed RNA polymerase specialized sigma24 family protein